MKFYFYTNITFLAVYKNKINQLRPLYNLKFYIYSTRITFSKLFIYLFAKIFKMSLDDLRDQILSNFNEESVKVNQRLLVDKVLARYNFLVSS